MPDNAAIWRERGLDPITMELIKNSLQAIVDEGSFTLGRTCASQLIKDVQDFSVGLCDEHGDLIALSITQPSQIGVIPAVVKSIIRYLDQSPAAGEGQEPMAGAGIEPGDVLIVNDPYHGGSHLNDLHIVKPVFFDVGADGRAPLLLGYATTKAHHTDVGGRVPGSMAFDNTEIFQEGLRIPPLKLYERGQPNPTLLKLLQLNVRYPDVLLDDINAQVAALTIGAEGLVELAAEHGADQLRAYLAALLDYGELLARTEIATWPDGVYEFEDRVDDDGVTGQPIVIHVETTVRGDEVDVDFAGTSPQVPAAVNFPPYEGTSLVYLVVRCCLPAELPNNSGLFRTVRTAIPEGCVLNPKPPAPCSERGLAIYRVGDAIFGAFAQVVPHGVMAAGDAGCYLMRISGRTSRDEPFLCVDLVQGTWGARHAKDGIDGIANFQVNHTNTPVEVIEANFPLRVECHRLVPDTGGPGRYRGGVALERAWRYVAPAEGTFRSRSDRRTFPPYGVAGGGTGSPSRLELERDGAPPVELDSKVVMPIRPGDLVRLRISGGGGWGDPFERDPARVLRDVRSEKVSVGHAQEAYGVVIDERSLAVDAAATARLRAARRSQPEVGGS